MTKLVAIVTNLDELKKSKQLLRSGVDLVELRIDWFNVVKRNALFNILRTSHKNFRAKTICTIRLKKDGGKWDDFHRPCSEFQRIELFKRFIPLCGYVDIELNSKILLPVIKTAKDERKKVIISYHNFNPGVVSTRTLHKIFLQAARFNPDIIKIAVYIRNFKQLRKCIEFFREHLRLHNLAFIPMSKEISFARYLFMCLGSVLTYGHIQRSVAPGQITINDLIKFTNI
ncbi:MAG: type I 3-dehydroquinate dehydratase [Elusimicrobiota bacterium]|nr:type I 3-dehydroquinate dehydratase [Elusimicrobiota bacterium]